MKYGLSDKTLDTLNVIFRKYPGIESVLLYGSRAKGNYRNGSDIDLTIKAADNFSFSDLLRISGDFDDSNLPYLVDVSIYEKLSNDSLQDHINRVGKVLYCKKQQPQWVFGKEHDCKPEGTASTK